MAEKNDDQTTPTGASPVYDSLVESPEPERVDPNSPLPERSAGDHTTPDHTVEATVEPDTQPEHTQHVAEEPLPEEPEEIVVADTADADEYRVDEGNRTAVIDETPVVVDRPREQEYRPRERESTPTPPQYVYVNNPTAPVKKSNRLFGVLVGLLATIAFSIVFFVVIAIIATAREGAFTLGFLAEPSYYLPALFFLVGFIVLALIVNRGGWGLYVFGSIFVGLFVYFGSVTAVLVANGLVLKTPEEAADLYRLGLSNSFYIAAALTAREVALWTGAIIARRGRKVKERNAEALDDYMREKEAARRN